MWNNLYISTLVNQVVENSTFRRESHYLEASCSHHEFHMVWKQTRVPSLSKMTRPGLKALSCARSA